jgi:ATP-dependent DNA helicase RecG
MSELLPIKVEDIVNARLVENIRLEYKSTWDEFIKVSVINTICAFANDLYNINGGYIILGVDAPQGAPILPPKGFDPSKIERIQKEVRGSCKKYLDPEYQPIIYPTIYMGNHIIILYVPAGDNKPYSALDEKKKKPGFFVRQGSETVDAKNDILRQLMEQTAHTPYDDRRNNESTLHDISPMLVKRFLYEVNSDLLNAKPPIEDVELYKALRIITTYGEVLIPKNVGILFFNEHPEEFFQGAAFSVSQFGDDAGGNLIEEKRFEGPVDAVIRNVTKYLDDLTNMVQLRKLKHKAAVERAVAYPYEALEEAITNAGYHRGYDNSEANRVYLYPDRIEIISYPGPVSGVTLQHLAANSPVPPFPARNRRIGEFLKELKLAEMRGTGIPKIRRTMSQNGSPDPKFDFDETRSYFCVTLPAHPRYVLVHALRESSYLWSIGEKQSAIDKLITAFQQQPGSGAICSQLIQFLYELGKRQQADDTFYAFHKTTLKTESEQPYIKYAKILISENNKEKAKEIILLLPEEDYWSDPVDTAILFHRLKMHDEAHRIFYRIYPENEQNFIYLSNFAQTKIAITRKLVRKQHPQMTTIDRLEDEAIDLLRRAISVSEDRTALGWCWYNLGHLYRWRKYPKSLVEEAYKFALDYCPQEVRFKDSYKKAKSPSKNDR